MFPTPADLDVEATGVLLAVVLGVLGLFVTGLGIVASGYIAAKVAARPILTQRSQRLAALAGIAATATTVLDQCRVEADAFEVSRQPPKFDLQRVDTVSAAIAEIPKWEVSPGVLAQPLIEVQESLGIARQAMVEMMRVGRQPSDNYAAHFFPAAVERAAQLADDVLLAAMDASRGRKALAAGLSRSSNFYRIPRARGAGGESLSSADS